MFFGVDESATTEPKRLLAKPEATVDNALVDNALVDDALINATEASGDERAKWLFAALGLLAGLALAAGVFLLWPEPDAELTQADVDEAVDRALAATADGPALAAQAFAQIAPSLVVVRAWEPGVDTTSRDDQPAVIGTGVVINENGQILTSDHLVAGAGSIELSFADGSTSPAISVSSDPDQDIAVLEATGTTGVLVPATMGNSRTLAIGDDIFAVGNPLGLTGSLSAGVVSGLQRSIPFPGDDDRVLEDLIQFDAAVNQGNSGGPLLNRDGHVVGIVTALADPSQQGYFIGIGFAVPIDIAAGGTADGPSQ